MARKTKNDVFYILENRSDYLYKVNCLTRQSYLNWCIEFVIQNEIELGQLKKIDQITRNNTYNLARTIKDKRPSESNRDEEWFVLDMFNNKIAGTENVFGKILNYQIPLKDKLTDKSGKIDFVSIKDNEFLIVEIKAEHSNESILKAILEIQSYYQLINKNKLLTDFNAKNCVIKKVVAIFENTIAHNQLKNNNIKSLLKILEIEVKILRLSSTLCALSF